MQVATALLSFLPLATYPATRNATIVEGPQRGLKPGQDNHR
jgi:hypothetical protein